MERGGGDLSHLDRADLCRNAPLGARLDLRWRQLRVADVVLIGSKAEAPPQLHKG